MTIPHKRKATWLGGNERSGGKGAGEHGPDKGLSRRGVSEESGMGEAIDGLPVPVEKHARVSTQFSEPMRSASHMSAKSCNITWRSTKITDPPHGASHTGSRPLSPFFWPYKVPSSQADVKPAQSSMQQLANNTSITATLRNQFGALSTTLPLPTDDSSLSCSQLLFKLGTQINPLSLTISTDEEYFLFMEMRWENKWVSFGMSAKRWVEATILYNSRLTQQRMGRRLSTIPKNPCTLFEKLGDVESQVLERLTTSNFKSEHILALSSDSDHSSGA